MRKKVEGELPQKADFVHFQTKTKGKKYCLVAIHAGKNDEGHSLLQYGISVCSRDDKYDEKKAECIALGRAIKNPILTEEFVTQADEKDFNRIADFLLTSAEMFSEPKLVKEYRKLRAKFDLTVKRLNAVGIALMFGK